MIPASLRVKKIKVCIICEGYEEANYLTRLKTNEKKIEELTGVSDYDAKIEQRDKINKQITKENYLDMKTRIKNILQDYTKNPSTNFYEFLAYFEDSCSNWIDIINKKINNN